MKFLILPLITIVWLGCNGQTSAVSDSSKDIIEGHLVYDISKSAKGMAFEVEFNAKNVKIYERNSLMPYKIYIVDKRIKEVLSLYPGITYKINPKDFSDVSLKSNPKENLFFYQTSEEMELQAMSSNYGDTLKTVTQEFKTIHGYRCQKIILHLGEQVTVEAWVTDKIKTGVILPGTPLAFENAALEYETKILGSVDSRFVIRSISDKSINDKEFEHAVPDDYNLLVPAAVFSLDSLWADKYEENKFISFQYPAPGKERDSVKKYIRDGLSKITPDYNKIGLTIDFIVAKDGSVSDVEIDHGRENEFTGPVKKMLYDMPKWTPARVKGKPESSSGKVPQTLPRLWR